MKKILGAIGGIAVIGLLSYPGFGLLVEKGVHQQLDAMPKQYGMSIELTDFHRHWFTSDAKILWKWQIPAHLTQNAQGQTITISPQNYEKEFQIHIYHGPLVVAGGKFFFGIGHADTKINWPLFSNLPVKEDFTKDSVFPQINIQMALNFLFQTTWNTQIPAFKLTAVDLQNQIDWQGLSIHNKIRDNSKSLKGSIQFKGGLFKQNKSVIGINNLESNYNFNHDATGLYIGELGFNVSSIDIQDLNQHKFHFGNWFVDSRSDISDGKFSTEFKMSLDEFSSADKKMGPFEIDIEAAKINAVALNQMHEVLKPQQNASPSFRQKNIWALLTAVPELLKHGLEVNLKKLHFVLDNGTIDSNAKIVLLENNSETLMSLQPLQNLQGNLQLELTQTMLSQWISELVEKQMSAQQLSPDQSPASSENIHQAAMSRTNDKLASLVKSGVLISQASNYLMRVKLDKGQLTINDLPFDSSWLIV